MDTVFDLLWWE